MSPIPDVPYHGKSTILAGITALQTFYYPRSPGQRLSKLSRIIIPLYGVIILGNVVGVFVLRVEHLIDMLYLLSYFKIYVNLAKYSSQVSRPLAPYSGSSGAPSLLT